MARGSRHLSGIMIVQTGGPLGDGALAFGIYEITLA